MKNKNVLQFTNDISRLYYSFISIVNWLYIGKSQGFPKMPNSSSPKGFTLIELMVTISIASVVMGLAIPSFMDSINSNRLTATANEFVAALNYTRSEAVKRGIQVTMAPTSATAAQWESGWTIFVDINENEAFNDDGDSNLCETNATNGSPTEDCLLRSHDVLAGGVTLRSSTATNYKNYAAYRPSGDSVNHAGETFRVCDVTAATTKSRTIVMNFMGRSSVPGTNAATCP